ncbi:MAG: hypothetical protein H8E59_11155 [Actinobacteria bacterium]|nr:hypothetical protein [Actinomycetota bacterium]
MNEQLVLTTVRNRRPSRPAFLLDARTRAIGRAGVARARAELKRRAPVDQQTPQDTAAIADKDPGPQRRSA